MSPGAIQDLRQIASGLSGRRNFRVWEFWAVDGYPEVISVVPQKSSASSPSGAIREAVVSENPVNPHDTDFGLSTRDNFRVSSNPATG